MTEPVQVFVKVSEDELQKVRLSRIRCPVTLIYIRNVTFIRKPLLSLQITQVH